MTLELIDVVKAYSDTIVPVKGLSLTVHEGEFVTLLGSSGCGKSTILRLVAGLEEVTSGSIVLNGKDVTHATPAKRDVAMVFQSYALYPHYTVFDNIASPLRIRKVAPADVRMQVEKIAHQLGLEPLLARKPKALSGGQRQRVALARALVRKPKAFLLDEPLSNLDALLREQVRFELGQLFFGQKAPVVYVTHDQTEAMSLSDRIVVLHRGRVQQIGTPEEIYQRPANEYVARFVGSPKMNLLPVEEMVSVVQEAKRFLPQDQEVSSFGIRPQAVSLERSDGAFSCEGQVVHREHLGEAYLYTFELQANQMQIRGLFGQGDVGASTRLWFPADQCHWFDSRGERVVT